MTLLSLFLCQWVDGELRGPLGPVTRPVGVGPLLISPLCIPQVEGSLR